MVFWTGDFVPHEVWADDYPTKAEKYLRYVTDVLLNDFGDFQSYPILGNHDFE